MVATRSRKRGTGESDGVMRMTRSVRNSGAIDNEPSSLLPKAKRQRTEAAATRASRKTRALKPVATNANSNAQNARGTKSKTTVTVEKPVPKKPRGRPPKKHQEESQSKDTSENATHQEKQQPHLSTGATRAGADDGEKKRQEGCTTGERITALPAVSLDAANKKKSDEQPGPKSYQDGEPYNIDARDAQDPLSVTDYVEDMYNHFLQKEPESHVNRNYMGTAEEKRQLNITEPMRCILVDWLIEVHYKFKLFPETLYLTINILDRFLSEAALVGDIISKRDLQLVGVTSLLVAAKYEEMYVPELRDLTYICDGAYTEAKILRMEERILKTLKYNVTVPTPHTFLVRYLKAAKADKLMAQLASFLLDGTLLSLQKFTCKFLPSQMAAAAILLARRQVGRHNWSPTLVAYSSYREENVLPVAKTLLEEKWRLDRNRELMALAKKYSKNKYGKVSHIAFLPLDSYVDEGMSGDDSMDDSDL